MKLCHFVVRLFFETTNQIDDWEKDMEKQKWANHFGRVKTPNFKGCLGGSRAMFYFKCCKAAFRPVLSIGLCSAPRHGVKATHVTWLRYAPSHSPRHWAKNHHPSSNGPEHRAFTKTFTMSVSSNSKSTAGGNADGPQNGSSWVKQCWCVAAPRCVCHLNIHKHT